LELFMRKNSGSSKANKGGYGLGISLLLSE